MIVASSGVDLNTHREEANGGLNLTGKYILPISPPSFSFCDFDELTDAWHDLIHDRMCHQSRAELCA